MGADDAGRVGRARLVRARERDALRRLGTVADLGPEVAGEFARRLWVIPPGGSLL